ncbi:MAG: hypothetical protein OXD47_04370 [Gammaproteobacteria bacterium]|nr:hypothetical protein [Gammaproteobacteria bacterium]MCY4283157.1 hypothetical protein [Gammaproteobacteria bacterium]MCY4338017.1 hypothetical protein [Gammaproteobacteria bacterium]
MKNTTMNKPSPDVIELAINLIKQQDSTPESPGALTADGQVTYCAAAALAAAGLQSVNVLNENGVFSDGIGTQSFADKIRKVFVEQGWSLDLCNEIMLLNDAFAPHERSRRIIDYFQRM